MSRSRLVEWAAQKMVADECFLDNERATTADQLGFYETMQATHQRAAEIYASRCTTLHGAVMDTRLRFGLLITLVGSVALSVMRFRRFGELPDLFGCGLFALMLLLMISDTWNRRRRARIVASRKGVR